MGLSPRAYLPSSGEEAHVNVPLLPQSPLTEHHGQQERKADHMGHLRLAMKPLAGLGAVPFCPAYPRGATLRGGGRGNPSLLCATDPREPPLPPAGPGLLSHGGGH